MAYGRLPASFRAAPLAVRLVAPLLTTILFGALAWRFGSHFELVPYSVFGTVGVLLGLIDLVELRVPGALVFVGIAAVGALFAAAAAADSRWPDFLRALASLAILVTIYLMLALIFAGDLGAGDVKLSALLGLVLGWEGWSEVTTGTFLGWLAAALVWFILRATGRRKRQSVLPLGPFLVAGALVAIVVMPT